MERLGHASSCCCMSYTGRWSPTNLARGEDSSDTVRDIRPVQYWKDYAIADRPMRNVGSEGEITCCTVVGNGLPFARILTLGQMCSFSDIGYDADKDCANIWNSVSEAINHADHQDSKKDLRGTYLPVPEQVSPKRTSILSCLSEVTWESNSTSHQNPQQYPAEKARTGQ